MENIIDKLKDCKAGDILEIQWDRGNGELRARFYYYGINSFDNSPNLIDVRNTDVKSSNPKKPAENYFNSYLIKPVVFFDAMDSKINIKEINRIFLMPSYKTDGVHGIEGINWTRDEEGSIIEF